MAGIEDFDPIDESLNLDRKENITDGTKGEIAENIDDNSKMQLIGKIHTALGAEFQHPYMFQNEVKGMNDEYTKISVRNSKVPQRSEPEIAITIQPDGMVIIRVSPYSHYEIHSFYSEKISLDSLFGEIRNIKTILNSGTLPREDAVLKIQSYPDPDTFEEEEWVTEEELETGYTRLYNSIFVKEGEESAAKFYEEHAQYIIK